MMDLPVMCSISMFEMMAPKLTPEPSDTATGSTETGAMAIANDIWCIEDCVSLFDVVMNRCDC